jgi:hypothetical protein
MELHQALTEIESIRRQVAYAEKFRGYRAIPVAAGGLCAVIGAVVQASMVPDASRDLSTYLAVWVLVAIVAGGIPAVDVWLRHRGACSLRSTLARLAFEQFAPCVIAGGLLTAVIVRFVPQDGWMLPSLWAVIFSLGIFASFRLLPKATVIVAVWYLLAGCVCLALGPNRAGLASWTMGVTFGIGQMAMALVLLGQERETDDGQ